MHFLFLFLFLSSLLVFSSLCSSLSLLEGLVYSGAPGGATLYQNVFVSGSHPFTFKGLNNLFTGLSTSPGPASGKRLLEFCFPIDTCLLGLLLPAWCNIHDNRVGLLSWGKGGWQGPLSGPKELYLGGFERGSVKGPPLQILFKQVIPHQ